jgi:hypothetical protein
MASEEKLREARVLADQILALVPEEAEFSMRR